MTATNRVVMWTRPRRNAPEKQKKYIIQHMEMRKDILLHAQTCCYKDILRALAQCRHGSFLEYSVAKRAGEPGATMRIAVTWRKADIAKKNNPPDITVTPIHQDMALASIRYAKTLVPPDICDVTFVTAPRSAQTTWAEFCQPRAVFEFSG